MTIRHRSAPALGSSWRAPSGGTWIGPNGSTPATAQYALNEMRASPWDVRGTATIKALALGVTTGQANGLMRLAIYDDDGTGQYPGALIQDFGTVSCASATDVASSDLSTPITISNKRVWLVTRQEGTAATQPTVRIANMTTDQPATDTLNATTLQTAWKVLNSTGSLPATFTTGGALTAGAPPLRAKTA